MSIEKLKVFVVSPTDVKEEREIIKSICEELNKRVSNIKLEPILWEYSSLPMPQNPQEAINDKLERADIYIVVLWYRLGSNLPNLTAPITNTKNPTGTQYEIEWLIHNKKEDVYLFLKNSKINVHLDELDEANRQRQELVQFLETIEVKSPMAKKSFQEFQEKEEFKEKVESTLIDILEKKNISIAPKDGSNDIINHKIDSSYYMGLYIFLAFADTMIFIWLTRHANSLSMDTTNIVLSTILGVLATLFMAIKVEPITTSHIQATFKQVVKALFKRVLVLLFLASMLSFTIWYLILPTIQEIVSKIFK